MAEDDALRSIASQWIDTLLARGVTIEARGRRLVLHPKGAFGAMSTDERAIAKQHRTEIIEVVRTCHGGWARPSPRASVATVAPVTATALSVPPAPTYCTFCMRAPCCGPDHHAVEVLHERDPAVYWTFRERLRARDEEEEKLRCLYRLTPIVWE
jgi:hypothetical protein